MRNRLFNLVYTPKIEIIAIMQQEDAYTETTPGDIIQFKYALTLSISQQAAPAEGFLSRLFLWTEALLVL